MNGTTTDIGAGARAGAGPGAGGAARLGRVTAPLRGLAGELRTTSYDPLPASVWLRWLPHGMVVLYAVGMFVANLDQLIDGYRLGVQIGLLCALAQLAAGVLVLWFPVPAGWLSLAVFVGVALGLPEVPAPGADFGAGPPWPWTPPGVAGHAMVLFLLALRSRTAVSFTMLGLTGVTTWFLQVWLGGQHYQATGMIAFAVFVGCTTLGAALRGRRVARIELVEQTGITAEERARRTLLEERSRIARELHDVVAHHMSVISIQAQVAPHLVADPSDELRENLAGIRQNALDALTELRRVLGVLRSEHPEDQEGPGAGTAPHAPQPTLDRLDSLIDNTRTAGVEVSTHITGEPARPYPPGMELSAYRIVQEALSNVLRHAPGASVRVELTHFPEGLYLGVVNSSPSRPVQPSPGAGHGLLGMRERAAMLGGHLMATRTLHGGFSVSAFLPREAGTPAPDPHMPGRTGGPLTATTQPISKETR
ncbi:sensor histidine kinase [Streptomyces sp. NPDC091377]|uniref:sensor histidine kinase n=1 Tax=Streptomyces sp. NPDC091377 TaxID=3365995 RepID=UPI0038125C93